MKPLSLIFLFLVSVAASCNRDTGKHPEKVNNPEKYKEPLVNINKTLVNKESEEIENYIARHNWNMLHTGSGLRYLIYKKGDGEQAKEGRIAVINYKINLLNGKLCYSSDELGAKEFLIGQGGVESGLEEGIKLLRVGDKAKFILPPHLAYGLTGDDNKIPARATLVYDVELVKLK